LNLHPLIPLLSCELTAQVHISFMAIFATDTLAGEGSTVEMESSLESFLRSTFSEALWFAAGFLLFHLSMRLGFLPSFAGIMNLGSHRKATLKADAKPIRSLACKAICADSAAGKNHAVLKTWQSEKMSKAALPLEAIQAVALALAEVSPETLASELASYLRRHPTLARPKQLHAIVESLIQFGTPKLAEELLLQHPNSADSGLHGELLVGGFASQGNHQKVNELLSSASDNETKHVMYSAAVRGFLKAGSINSAAKLISKMNQLGFKLSPSMLMSFIQSSLNSQDIPLTDALLVLPELSSEIAAVALADCQVRDDISTASMIEQRLRDQHTALTYVIYEPLLKLNAKADENKALSLFKEIREKGLYLSEGLCGLVLSRCGDTKHLQLAEVVQNYLREKKMTSLATYKTLMKVYASCNLFDRACNLLEHVLEDGIEPDHVMYGCLVKFAVKCGREDLSDRLFMKAQGGDVQNYMWLIRSAGRKGDVPRALELLKGLRSKKADQVDAGVYNCVLDVCLSCHAIKEAEEVLQDMRKRKLLTLVTYNTLMKHYCLEGNFRKARSLLFEMRREGLSPDTASFNCLISAAVSADDVVQAWDIFDEMERHCLKADHFTISILMKIVRRSHNVRDASRALAVLDRSGVNICEDDVLLNTVLDACIHSKDFQRLAQVVAEFERAALKPTVQNYGLVIKAYSSLRQTEKCWKVWDEMTVARGLVPSDVALSCMLDALINAGDIEEALKLFKAWRTHVPLNTVIFSTIIKGFASQGDAARAMEMYREVKSADLKMNIVAFSTLIDAQAKAGNTELAESLLLEMEKEGVQPNTITYSSIVKGHCLRGDMDSALKSFETMLSKGLKADTVIYNTLLDGSVRSSRFELCDQLLRDMTGYGVKPSNFTLSIVIKMWGKRRRLQAAFDAVRIHMKECHHRLDASICNAILSACFHNNKPQRALEAMAEMKTWSNCDGPDGTTYNSLVGGLLRAGWLKEACAVAIEVTEVLKKSSLAPEVLKQLHKALSQQKLLADLWPPLESALRAARQHIPDGLSSR
jgi:pentatricopeptide repeat protein